MTGKLPTSLLFIALTLLALCSLLLALLSGTVAVSLTDLWQTLGGDNDDLQSRVISELRWPRAAAAFVTGGLLGLAGVLMQALLRNPLADPYILGISGGSATAALLALSAGLAASWLPAVSFAGAALAMLLVLLFAQMARRWNSDNPLLLVGIVLAAGWGALINLLLVLADTYSVQGMLFWLMGDLSSTSLPSLPVIVVLLGGLIISWFYGRDLDLMLLGEQKARTLGSPVRQVRLASFVIAAVCTASAVSLAGTVGFIGLIIPHLVRQVTGTSHRILLPASVLAGGTLLTFADTGARNFLSPLQLPVGVITAMIGVPVFLYLLTRRR